MLQTLSAKSDMVEAIRYAISRWVALTRYLVDGTVEINNNAVERALRVVALGRNYVLSMIRCNRLLACWIEALSVQDQSLWVAS